MKTSDFVSVQIQYLSNRLLTLVQEGKVNSELYRKTVTSIVNPETLRVTKELLTSTPITLDCERSVNINSEQPASSKFSTPDVANNNAQESFFTDSSCSSPLSAPVGVIPENTDFHVDYLAFYLGLFRK